MLDTQNSLIPERQMRLLSLASEIEMDRDAGYRGHYASRIMAQLSLPYRNPGGLPEWSRRNNALTLTITPGSINTKNGREKAYPYGVIPRYLLTWMTTEAVRTQSRQLHMGTSLSSFLATLGLNSSGASGRRVMDQLNRLAVASLNVEDIRKQGDRWNIQGANFHIASRYDLWFSSDQPNTQDQLLDSTITLSEEFYRDAITAPVKLRPEVLRALSGSPMRLDLYTWLSYRLRRLQKASTVTWAQLEDQFGADYAQRRQFKAKFLQHLRAVQIFFPDNALKVLPGGVRLNRTLSEKQLPN